MTLDDIKRSIGHDAGCASTKPCLRRCETDIDTCLCADDPVYAESVRQPCNCSRRDKIALLERLQEPPRELLVSMALRLHHDFLLPKDEFGQGFDEDEREMILAGMRNVIEEINGTGFYEADANECRKAFLGEAE